LDDVASNICQPPTVRQFHRMAVPSVERETRSSGRGAAAGGVVGAELPAPSARMAPLCPASQGPVDIARRVIEC
jgi:hypothetical protein